MADQPGRKVFVAMSGGVDSSVAALLLQQQGFEVTGITFKLFEADESAQEDDERACCSLENVERARAVCRTLGIPHYTMSFVEDFGREVIGRFVCEYAVGRTPNPCVLCNRHIKFDSFLRKAVAIGADFVATGHHARIAVTAGGYRLLPGADPAKDQSYALAHLNQSVMARVLLPVGEYRKRQVRELAAAAGLPAADTAESQDICFVRSGTYADFLAARDLPQHPGPIVDTSGRHLGLHLGLHRYTVGQRKHLGVSTGRRLYVVEKRLADNTLVVGDLAEVCRPRVTAEEVNWCDLPAGQWPDDWARPALQAMLRYRQPLIPCRITAADPTAGSVQIELSEPAIAAPGQLLALYDGYDNHVVMGGTIV